MPTYEYECLRCDHKFEIFQGMSDRPRKRCPKCRGKLRRVIGTGSGVLFKGSGFYTTDYRSENYRKSAEAEKSAGKEKSAKKGEKTDKPQSKHSSSDTKKS